MFPDTVSFPDDKSLLPSSLTALTISGMSSLTSLPLPKLHSLTSLQVSYMKSLVSLPLPKLDSLTSLEVSAMKSQASLPLQNLTSLQSHETLIICDCPIIKKKRCLKGKGEYFPNTAYIPFVHIDHNYLHELKYNEWKCKCMS